LRAPPQAIVMGGALEFAKLVGASWLSRSWSTAFPPLRWAILAMVVALMGLNAMGCYGYLTRAHLQSQLAGQIDVESRATPIAQQSAGVLGIAVIPAFSGLLVRLHETSARAFPLRSSYAQSDGGFQCDRQLRVNRFIEVVEQRRVLRQGDKLDQLVGRFDAVLFDEPSQAPDAHSRRSVFDGSIRTSVGCDRTRNVLPSCLDDPLHRFK